MGLDHARGLGRILNDLSNPQSLVWCGWRGKQRQPPAASRRDSQVLVTGPDQHGQLIDQPPELLGIESSRAAERGDRGIGHGR